ncbi:uncharacterized protein YjbI with pentapeptide repeats [Paenibacillus phyllosphaerae]|uniref:Uncharacterized protein YjbI with pentapeptide repeats n=1 Tax=Paenibacillus phyllosphaerae TaxID=274593 RepID=A0A7W5B458_9BACL|nr:hypothetical protein [Paenibacillus phyllosphaerae]MBB3114067.1 uncharacterized protein YjbI with pentapeptide repeats [Paenibacillus phyllosphaerae]
MQLTQKMTMDSKNGLELQDLRNEEIHMVCFKESDFHGIDMRNTKIAHTNFVNSRWEHIYFSNIHIKFIQMGGTVFENIIRPNAEMSQLSEEPGTDGWVNIEPVVFKTSDLSTARFEKCDLSNVQIKDCIIEGLSIDGILITDLLENYKKNALVD